MKKLNIKTFEEKTEMVKEIIEVHGSKGNWDMDEYMHGMLNGMLMIFSIYNDLPTQFRDKPEEGYLKESKKFRDKVLDIGDIRG